MTPRLSPNKKRNLIDGAAAESAKSSRTNNVRFTPESGHVGKLTTFNGGS
jgi:hypothetical protein